MSGQGGVPEPRPVDDSQVDGTHADRPPIDKAQYGLALGLAVVGVYTLIDARGLNVGFGDPVGPRVFPYIIGTVMIVLAVFLAVATARGDVPEGEAGEDVDLTTPPDWTTVGLLIGVLLFTIVTVNLLGWAISGALLFVGCARALGSRTLLRDAIVGGVMSVGSWYFFYVVLDVPLTPGILDGIL